jgi:hypothetical protein
MAYIPIRKQFSQGYGLEVVSGRWDEDASLPKHVTVDVLESGETSVFPRLP